MGRADEPACARGQLRLVLSLPHANYYGGSPVPFRVQIINLTSQPCSVTALQPPSGLTTELVYVRILDSHGRRVLIPGGPPGLRVRMLPTALAAHQVFSYTCTWTGRVWTGTGAGQPPGLGGVPAPSGRYTAVAVLANPAVQTGPLHFVLKRGRERGAEASCPGLPSSRRCQFRLRMPRQWWATSQRREWPSPERHI